MSELTPELISQWAGQAGIRLYDEGIRAKLMFVANAAIVHSTATLQRELAEAKAENETLNAMMTERFDQIAALSQRLAHAQSWKESAIAVLRRAETSLGSFVSDEGWDQSDMDVMDDVAGVLARHDSVRPAPKPLTFDCGAVQCLGSHSSESDFCRNDPDESYNWCPQCSQPIGSCECAAQPKGGDEWQPIETAPKGVLIRTRRKAPSGIIEDDAVYTTVGQTTGWHVDENCFIWGVYEWQPLKLSGEQS